MAEPHRVIEPQARASLPATGSNSPVAELSTGMTGQSASETAAAFAPAPLEPEFSLQPITIALMANGTIKLVASLFMFIFVSRL